MTAQQSGKLGDLRCGSNHVLIANISAHFEQEFPARFPVHDRREISDRRKHAELLRAAEKRFDFGIEFLFLEGNVVLVI